MATKWQQTKSKETSLQQEDKGSRDEELGKLIEVFRPFLLKTLRVSHLLVFLHHISEVKDVAAMVHKKENSGDLQGATEMLMAAINSSHEPGKWQAFIDALREVEDTVILQTLLEEVPAKGDGWYDNEDNSKLIDLLSNDINHRLRLEPLLPIMVQEKLILRQDEDKLRVTLHNNTTRDANAVLLLLMPRHNKDWFHKFMKILYFGDEHHKELAKLIDPLYCKKILKGSQGLPSHNHGETSERLDRGENRPARDTNSLGVNLGKSAGSEKDLGDKSLPEMSINDQLLVSESPAPQPNTGPREATCSCGCCSQVWKEVQSLRSEVAEMKKMLQDVLSTIQ